MCTWRLRCFYMPPPEVLPRLIRQLRQQRGVPCLQLSDAVDQRQLRAAAVQVHIACAHMPAVSAHASL
jgi:hypothetical protein